MTSIYIRSLICHLQNGKDFGWNNEWHIMSSFLENPNLWMCMQPWIRQWNSCRTIQTPKGWCHQSFAFIMSANVSKSGRPSSGHRTEKGQSLSQFPRRVVPKNVLTIWQLHSSPMPVRPGFSIMQTKNFQMFKLGLEKAENPEIKLPAFTGSQRKQENSRKTFISVSLTMLQPLNVWVITNCGIFLMRWEYQTTLPDSWETCLWVRK